MNVCLVFSRDFGDEIVDDGFRHLFGGCNSNCCGGLGKKKGKLASRDDGKGGLVLTFLLALFEPSFAIASKSLSSFLLRDISNVKDKQS